MRAAIRAGTAGELDVAALLDVYWRYSQLLQERGDLPQAEEMLREAVSVSWARCGQGHAASLTTLRLLASLLHEEGRLQESAKLFRLVLEKSSKMPLVVLPPAAVPAQRQLQLLRDGSKAGAAEEEDGGGKRSYAPLIVSTATVVITRRGSAPGGGSLHSSSLFEKKQQPLTMQALARADPATLPDAVAAGDEGGFAALPGSSGHNTLPVDAANGLGLLLLEGVGPISEAVQARAGGVRAMAFARLMSSLFALALPGIRFFL